MSAREDWLVSVELAPDADDPLLAPFYRAAAAGAVVLPCCASCGTALELDQVECDACERSIVDWRPVDPRGVVHAVTTVHRREPGLIRATAPYPVIDVELVSGHRLVMTTTGPGAAPEVGQPVHIGFRHVGGVALPAVRLADASQPALEVDS